MTISREQAKQAWVNGEKLEAMYNDLKEENTWFSIIDSDPLSTFDRDDIEFRIKPRTISINNIEVPAPFKPKYEDTYFIINPYCDCGYSEERHSMEYVGLGAWRTEDEIKQVVAALRSIFKV